jgi:hypothetical protein
MECIPDDFNPCEECDEDPDTCGRDPCDCMVDMAEQYMDDMRDCYD